jgi:hypothetical protein
MNEEADKKDVPEDVKDVASAPAATETPADENGPVNADHQDNDLHLHTVKKFMIASFAITLGFFVLMLMVHRFYKKSFAAERGVASAETRQIPGRDDALLQTQPLVDLQEYRDAEQARLNTTTAAVDHAVIPVEIARQLMLRDNAFPTPQPAAPAAETAPAAPAPMVAAPGEAPAAPAPVAPAPAAPASPAVAATAAPAAAPALDPALVAAGKVLWETQCMAACHTGKKGSIAPNIQNAFGTLRQLENHEPILMDEAYILNSLSNPNEHIAKGYMPVMMSFKETLSDLQKRQVAAYLQSMGKPIPVVAAPAPAPAPAPVAEAPAAVAEPAPAPQPPMPVEAPTTPPPMPAPAVEPAPAPVAPPAPTPAPPKPSGTIFV